MGGQYTPAIIFFTSYHLLPSYPKTSLLFPNAPCSHCSRGVYCQFPSGNCTLQLALQQEKIFLSVSDLICVYFLTPARLQNNCSDSILVNSSHEDYDQRRWVILINIFVFLIFPEFQKYNATEQIVHRQAYNAYNLPVDCTLPDPKSDLQSQLGSKGKEITLAIFIWYPLQIVRFVFHKEVMAYVVHGT